MTKFYGRSRVPWETIRTREGFLVENGSAKTAGAAAKAADTGIAAGASAASARIGRIAANAAATGIAAGARAASE
jgi:hypothetical protein